MNSNEIEVILGSLHLLLQKSSQHGDEHTTTIRAVPGMG